jgi:hypothetical protein
MKKHPSMVCDHMLHAHDTDQDSLIRAWNHGLKHLRMPSGGTLFSDSWRDVVLAVFFAAAIFKVMVDR